MARRGEVSIARQSSRVGSQHSVHEGLQRETISVAVDPDQVRIRWILWSWLDRPSLGIETVPCQDDPQDQSRDMAITVEIRMYGQELDEEPTCYRNRDFRLFDLRRIAMAGRQIEPTEAQADRSIQTEHSSGNPSRRRSDTRITPDAYFAVFETREALAPVVTGVVLEASRNKLTEDEPVNLTRIGQEVELYILGLQRQSRFGAGADEDRIPLGMMGILPVWTVVVPPHSSVIHSSAIFEERSSALPEFDP